MPKPNPYRNPPPVKSSLDNLLKKTIGGGNSVMPANPNNYNTGKIYNPQDMYDFVNRITKTQNTGARNSLNINTQKTLTQLLGSGWNPVSGVGKGGEDGGGDPGKGWNPVSSGGGGKVKGKETLKQPKTNLLANLGSPWAALGQVAPKLPGEANPYLDAVNNWLGNLGNFNQDANTEKYPLEYYQNYAELVPPTNTVMPDTYIAQANRIADIYVAQEELDKDDGGGYGGYGGYGGGRGGSGGRSSYTQKLPRWFLDMMYWRI